MSETGFPGTYSTTTVTQTATTVTTNIRFDPSYVRTIPGMLKIAIMVSCLNISPPFFLPFCWTWFTMISMLDVA